MIVYFQLPRNARIWSRLSGDEDMRCWTDTDHMLANLQDILGMQYRLAWIGHQIKGKPPTFDPVERPGEEAPTEADLMDPVAVEFLNLYSPGAEVKPISVPEAQEYIPEDHGTGLGRPKP